MHLGAETFWGGVLGHGLQPGRVYDEIAAIGAELAQAGSTVAELRPDVDVAIVWSTESDWALQFQPPLAHPGGSPDRSSYRTIVTEFYTGVIDAGLRPGVLPVERLDDPVDLAGRVPVLVVPALYVASDGQLDRLVDYARAGGHLIVGPRTAYADLEARARAEVAPGRLREAAGVHYSEYENLLDQQPVVGLEGHATRWAERLIVDHAEVLAAFEHPGGGRRPIVTTSEFGSGRVTLVGTVPDAALARSIFSQAATALWTELPASVTAMSAVNPAGKRLWFVHNWSGANVTVRAPMALVDVLRDVVVAAGTELELSGRDVRVLRQERA
jgi:beta-galactosidase